MKKFFMFTVMQLMILSSFLIATPSHAQSDKDKKIMIDCDSAKAEFLKTDPDMAKLFASAHGYLILPNVGKAALGVGGASGNGTVYEKGKVVGSAKMSQVTIGFQAGGQAYRELIFFETQEALDRFKKNKLEFSAQVSAVAVTLGASAKATYTDGMMVLTEQKGGLMYEASLGGQKFKYEAYK